MSTKKQYYEDVYRKECDSIVLECRECEKKGFQVILEETVFYPEGGGQPADRGTLNGIQVSDVKEQDDEILHFVPEPIKPGTKVHGVIDWERRFDHMQQHSGEHLVSGMLCSAFNCDNVGFHMGADVVTIDYNTEISWEDILKIEEKANRYIWENHPFVILWPTAEELATMEYRSKKELSGAVRITLWPGADTCACCGTHVAASAEIGIVKFLGVQKFRDGVRIELLSGRRAYEYLRMNMEQNQAIARDLSTREENTHTYFEKIQKELLEIKASFSELEEKYFHSIASAYRNAGNVLYIGEEMNPDNIRRLCLMISEICGGRASVFCGTDHNGGNYKYVISHQGQDIRDFIKTMNEELCGRGGGKDGFAQGSVKSTAEQIRSFFSR